MSRSTQRTVAALGALLVLAAGAAAAWALLRAPARPQAALTSPPIEVRAGLAPVDPAFGDPVTASVDVFVDTRLVDPALVRLDLRLPPYHPGATTRTTRTSGTIAAIHVTQRLDCLELDCVPRHAMRTFGFPLLTVHYREGGHAATAQVGWPRLSVHSRLNAARRANPTLRAGEARSAPPRFRVAPHRAGVALLVAAGVLGIAGLAILVALLAAPLLARRRGPGTVERILLELEGANGDSGRRRSALEQLARELASLDGSLSLESRVLAWAPNDPPPDAIDELARRARALVER